MPVITVASSDPILHVVAPLSLAAAMGTALVVDCDAGSGWPFPVGSLGDLAVAGPTADDLHPARAGIAVLGGSASSGHQLNELLAALRESWPAVVIRAQLDEVDVIRVDPALPWRSPGHVTVDVGFGRTSQASIPRPPSRLLRRLLAGQVDPRWRWFRHWRPVWEATR